MNSFDLYGWKNGELEKLKSQVENVLGIGLELHESAYHGGEYYLHGKLEEENFSLEYNKDLDEDEPTEADHSEYTVLLYVNRTKRSKELRDMIESGIDDVEFLRHEDV
jgi:hypothetical protein